MDAVACGFIVVLCLLMTPWPTSAQEAGRGGLILAGPAEIDTLGQHLDFLLDPGWTLGPADFAGPAPPPMAPLPAVVPDFGYTPARIWLRATVTNADAVQSRWLFFVHANFTQQIAIYRIGAERAVETLMDLDTASPFDARPVAYPQMVAPFELAPGDTATLLVGYYSQGSSRLSMSIETPESFATKARTTEAKNYAFYGMMLVMIAMALVALGVLRQPVLAAYAAYISSMLLYIAHSDGVAFQYLWPGFPEFNSMASVVAGSGVMVFGAVFAASFLQTARYHPVMHRVLFGLVAAVLVLDVVLWATAPQLLKQLLVMMISVNALAFLAAGLVAARTRFREVRFYLFAWLACLIPACLFTARYAFGLETTQVTLYDTIRLALVFDALMMGLAIFDGYNQQRQAAIEQTLAHAQRNLALGARLAVLEERYEQATALARQREESVKDTVHDLRQPMHALRLSLRQMFNPQSARTTDIGQVESALGYMEKLVSERLDDRPVPGAEGPRATAAAAAAGEPGLHGVLRGIADMFAAEAADKGLDLRLVLAAPDGPVAAYPLMRVVSNLVSNAIKYTRRGRVLIALRRHGEGHRIEVHDTGPGLGGAAFEEALARSHRLVRDRDAAEGSGLGLAVVRDIAAAQAWRISACEQRRTGASIRVDLAAPAGG